MGCLPDCSSNGGWPANERHVTEPMVVAPARHLLDTFIAGGDYLRWNQPLVSPTLLLGCRHENFYIVHLDS